MTSKENISRAIAFSGVLLASLTIGAIAQDALTGIGLDGYVRQWRETLTFTVGPNLDGDVMDETVTSSWVAGYVIPAGDITATEGIRTLAIEFTEASGSDAVLQLMVTGTNQWNSGASEVVTFESSGVKLTQSAFSPKAKVVVRILEASNLTTSDTLKISNWGGALVGGGPSLATDLLSVDIDGTQMLDGDPNTATALFLRFNPMQGTWNPATGVVSDGDIVEIIYSTSNVTAPMGRGYQTAGNASRQGS